MDTNPMVTITSFSSVGAAMALKTYLEGREIPVYIPDEYITQDDWDGPTPQFVPLNNIRVQVPANYEEQAASAMAAFFQENGR